MAVVADPAPATPANDNLADTQRISGWSGGVPMGVAPAAERLEGVVRARIAEPSPGSFKVREDRLLVTADGTAYVLRGRAAREAKVNHKATVAGTVAGGVVDVTSVNVGAPVAGMPSSGTTRVLLMLAYWTTPDSLTQSVAHDRFFNDGNAWYRDASYGALGQTGDTTPWLRIAGPGGGCYGNSYQIMQQAKDEAVKRGYNLANYDNFAVYFPNCGADDAAGYAAWAYLGTSQLWFNGYFDRREITHEQGHNYGLQHSHSYICDGGGLSGSCSYTEYGDMYDAMGSSSYSGHFSANQKTLLGWLGGGRTVDLSAGGTTTLAPMADDGTAPHAAVILVPDSNRKYWLEYRQRVDFDNLLPSSATNGVLVHATGAGSGSPDSGGSLIDVSPADGIAIGSESLKANSSWTTSEGIIISVGSVGPTGASVTVQTGTSVPTAPTSVVGKPASSTSATLTWAPPTNSGSSAITGYRVTRDAGSIAGQNPWSATVAATARSQAFTRLLPGSTYTLSVSAINAQGTGPAASVTVTVPAAVPTAPTSVSVSKDDRAKTASIQWQPPISNGGSPITGYLVARNAGSLPGQNPWSTVVSATTRSYTFTGLLSGSTYQLSVQAINGSGAGLAASGSVTLDQVATTNLLKNPGFEIDGNGDGRPDSWTSNAKFTRSNTSTYSGSYAGRHRTTNNTNHTISQVVASLSPGTTYVFNGKVNIPATSDTFTFLVRVQWLNRTGGVVRTDTIRRFTAATGGWTDAIDGMTSPTGTVKARLQMVSKNLNATIYVDEFILNQT